MIRILFFARLRESLGQSELTLPLSGPATVGEVREALLAQHPGWRDSLCAPNVLVACNQEIADIDTRIEDGDELAFYPPVTGG